MEKIIGSLLILFSFLGYSQNIKFVSELDRSLIISKKDSLDCDRIIKDTNLFIKKMDSLKETNYFVDIENSNSEFPGGINLFRRLIYESIKHNYKSRKGVNTISFIVENTGKISPISVLRVSDKKIVNSVKKALSKPVFNGWRSAINCNKKVEEKIIFSFGIK